ncbi:MAG: 3D-(3,5/4)-trihydroxycyclohexane-1,2-dione acylhydrolase (decyclizing) [Candidatus Limnocylindrales bacterium]
MARLTVAQAIVTWLANQYVERDGQRQRFFEGVYGIFGHGNVAGLGEALEAAQGEVRYYQARNEQAMVHTAVAFAKQSMRLRTFACTSSIGPGATNMVTGAANATVNRLPVLLLPGDRFATRRVKPVLQQLEATDAGDVSANDVFRPVSRYFDRIERPEALIDALPQAMRVLTSPAETGAVTLALPQDVQAEAWDWPAGLLEARTWIVPRPRPDATALASAVALIAGAQRPMIVVGGGVVYSDAAAALDQFVRRFGIPFTETQAGKGALPWDHPLNMGAIGSTGTSAGNAVAHDADVVIAIGTRLSDFPTMSWSAWQDPDVRFVAVNVTELDAAKAAALPLVGDARVTVQELGRALEKSGWAGTGPERRERLERLRREWHAEADRVRHLAAETHVSQPEAIRLVNEQLDDGIVVCAAGGLPGDMHKLWRPATPGSYHMEYGNSTMGYEIAGGIGVAMAEPNRRVHVMVGDGSYLMLANEILSARQEGIALTIVLLDNHGYRCIRNLSGACGADNPFNDFRARDPRTGTFSGEVLPVDFAANAASLGATVFRAGSPAELEASLRDARAISDGPTVIVVETNPEPGVPAYDSWWDVPVAEVSGSERVRQAREAYERDMRRTRRFV